jgi:hypothetical protein
MASGVRTRRVHRFATRAMTEPAIAPTAHASSRRVEGSGSSGRRLGTLGIRGMAARRRRTCTTSWAQSRWSWTIVKGLGGRSFDVHQAPRNALSPLSLHDQGRSSSPCPHQSLAEA